MYRYISLDANKNYLQFEPHGGATFNLKLLIKTKIHLMRK